MTHCYALPFSPVALMSTEMLSPDLASLASNAAVELDLMIRGEQTDGFAVKELAKQLSDATVGGTEQNQRRLQVDTATETLLGRAFVDTGSDPSQVLTNLFSSIERVANDLSGWEQMSEKDRLGQLLSFCLALSTSASAHRQMIFNMRPPHPNRR